MPLFLSSSSCISPKQAESDASSSEMSDDALRKLVSRLAEVGGDLGGEESDAAGQVNMHLKTAVWVCASQLRVCVGSSLLEGSELSVLLPFIAAGFVAYGRQQ